MALQAEVRPAAAQNSQIRTAVGPHFVQGQTAGAEEAEMTVAVKSADVFVPAERHIAAVLQLEDRLARMQKESVVADPA